MTDLQIATAWIVAGILLLIAELFIPGFTVAVFGIACIAAGVLAYFDVGFNGQLIAFAVTTVVLFVTLRPFMLRYLDRKSGHLRTNVAALVGKRGVVTQRVDPVSHTGRVVVEGDDWRAVSVEDAVVEPGQRVEVVRVEGTRLFIKRLA